MWKQIGEAARKLFSLSQRMEKLEESDEHVQEVLKEHDQRISRLTELVHHLAYELQRDRENHASERRLLLLEIENLLLRAGRKLPPQPPSDEAEAQESDDE